MEGGPVPASGKARYQEGTGHRESEMCISSWLSMSSAHMKNPRGYGLACVRAEVGYSAVKINSGNTDLLQTKSLNSYKVFSGLVTAAFGTGDGWCA